MTCCSSQSKSNTDATDHHLRSRPILASLRSKPGRSSRILLLVDYSNNKDSLARWHFDGMPLTCVYSSILSCYLRRINVSKKMVHVATPCCNSLGQAQNEICLANRQLRVFETRATGKGLEKLYEWVSRKCNGLRQNAPNTTF